METPALEELCDICNGIGKLKCEDGGQMKDVPCYYCQGCGRRPTKFGYDVLKFVCDRLQAKLGRN